LAATTRATYTAALADDGEILQRFGRTKVAAIDADELARFVHALETRTKRNRTEGQLRRSSVENILKPVRGALRHAVKEKLIPLSPFAVLDRDERPKADDEPHEPFEWDDELLKRLLAASRARASMQESRLDYAPLLELAARSGLRLGECLGLDWTDCELTKGAGALNVTQQWTRLRELAPPKAGSRRRVPIGDSLVQLLLELKMAAPNKTGAVFASRVGGRLSHRNVQRRGFDPAAADAGLEGASFHDLRHYFGSRLAERGLSARAIADAMGHSRTSTTERYISRINGEQADERVRAAMGS
jgi:integrase